MNKKSIILHSMISICIHLECFSILIPTHIPLQVLVIKCSICSLIKLAVASPYSSQTISMY